MKPKRLLDSYALLAYLNKEKNFRKVQKVLSDAQRSGRYVLMNEINIGEAYYILYCKRSQEKDEFFLDTVLAGLPILILPNNFEDVMNAARLKTEHTLSFGSNIGYGNLDDFAIEARPKMGWENVKLFLREPLAHFKSPSFSSASDATWPTLFCCRFPLS